MATLCIYHIALPSRVKITLEVHLYNSLSDYTQRVEHYTLSRQSDVANNWRVSLDIALVVAFNM